MAKIGSSVVVLSCDRFASLWPLFFDAYQKYWPDYEGNIFLVNNKLKYKHSGLGIINSDLSDERSWSDNLIEILKKVDTKYVLMMIDDAPLAGQVDTSRFNALLEYCDANNVEYLNLKASPRSKKLDLEGIGLLSEETDYRCSIVPNLWDKDVLTTLLMSGESAWQFEIFGSERARHYKNFRSIDKPFFRLDHLVLKGKLDIRFLKKYAHYDLKFPRMNFVEMSYQIIKEARRKLLVILPGSFVSFYRKRKYK
jgi:hypothetical protein